MKKFLSVLVPACVLFLNSCEHDKFPETLVGKWQSQTIEKTYYRLDVQTETTASLSTYTSEVLAGSPEVLALTYDPSTGKGTLSGNGRVLSVTALNEQSFSIKMSAGDFVFTPADPVSENTENIFGYWYNSKDEVGLLVCPKSAEGEIPALLTYKEEDPDAQMVMEYAEVGVLSFADEQHLSGAVVMDDGAADFSIQDNEMTLDIEGERIILSKRPSAVGVPASTEGVWTASMYGVITLTATIGADGNCVVEMAVQDPYTGEVETASMEGFVYYSPVAGIGGFSPYEEYYGLASRLMKAYKPAVQELSTTAFLFQATSATTAKMLLTTAYGLEIVFSKE